MGKYTDRGGCWKIAYAKLSHAEAALRKGLDKHGNSRDYQSMQAYRCPRCGRYHLGRDRNG